MEPRRVEKAYELFEEIGNRPEADREKILRERCGDDEALYRRVLGLLRVGDEEERTSDLANPASAPATIGRPRVAELAPPERIGHYHVRRVIASGGMGTVYEAVQEQPRRKVAIKVMKRGIASASALRRFEFESQILARLRHSNIAQVYEAGTHDDGQGGVPFFAMEYIPGARTLTEFADDKNLGTRERLELFTQVCQAVHHGHQKGIIHRDLKPGNILVGSSGEPKIIDFGVARATDSDMAVTTLQTDVGQLIGTLQYMSPEQCAADPDDLDTRSDVYALGIVLYELLCGRTPYDVSEVAIHEAARVIREEQPPKPSTINRTLRGDIETITLRAMEKDRDRRYGSASEMGDDIRRYLHDEPIVARRPSLVYQVRKFARRNRVAFGAAAVVAVVLVLASVVSSVFAIQAETARRRESQERAEAVAAREAAENAEATARVAQRQAAVDRDRARDLLKKYMFDVHDAIETLDGSLPARELLITTALASLDAMADETRGDAGLMRDLASAYDRVGDLQGGIRSSSLGDTEAAHQSYRAALALRQQLAPRTPDDADLQHELATSHIKIGDMLKRSGDTSGSLESYKRALLICEPLVAAHPHDVDARRQYGFALVAVGDALWRTGDGAAALKYYRQSMPLRRTLAAEQPNDPRLRRALASTCIRVGSWLFDRGEREEGLPFLEEAVRIRVRLVESNPQSARWRRDLGAARYFLGSALLELDLPETALEHLAPYLSASRQMARDNPTVARSGRDLALALDLVGQAYADLQDWALAEEHYREGRRTISQWADAYPGNTQYRGMVACADEHIAEALAARGDLAGAIDQADRAVETFRVNVNADEDDAQAQQDLARALMTFGRVLITADKAGRALSHLEEARLRYRDLLAASPQEVALRQGAVTVLHELSGLMVRLGDGATALAYAREAVSLDRPPSVALLRDLARAHHLAGDSQAAIEVAVEAMNRLDEETAASTDELRRTLEDDLRRYRER